MGRAWSGADTGSVRASRRLLLAAMAVVVASFILATAYGQLLLTHDTDALSIAYNAGPSIAAIADARADLARLRRDANIAVTSEGAAAAGARLDYVDTRHRLDVHLARYQALPVYPGERELQRGMPALLARLDGPPQATGAAGRRQVDEIVAATRALDLVLDRLSSLNQEQLAGAARKLPLHLHRTNLYSFALDGIGIVVALVACLLVARAFERNMATLARRSKELEHLAVQVGHEIANPLTPIQIALTLADEELRDPVAKNMVVRARRSLKRIEESIGGLTAFARAGLTRPAADEHAPLGAAIEAAARETGLAAAPVDPAWQVACAEPTLRELLTRFFDGAGTPEEAGAIEVRAVGRRLRVALVAKNGEGAPAVDPFEPQLRDRDSGRPGIDLRLATVRRMVQACGGSVGARYGRQQRTLWLELPRA